MIGLDVRLMGVVWTYHKRMISDNILDKYNLSELFTSYVKTEF